MKKLLLFICLCMLSGCFWHLRNPDEVPPQLKVVYLDDTFVDSRFNVQLRNLLQSLNITLTQTPQEAPYTLHAYAYSLQHNNPVISTTNVAITYTFTLTVTVSITDAGGKIIAPPHPIVTSTSVTVNTNQIFTINSTSVFQQDLQREGINLIYYWLTSTGTHQHLNSPALPHAT
jgi:LPS-assembly lipoprotein